jgi:hypothetical protein
MWPRHVDGRLEYSEGTRPQKPQNAAARPNRRQSQTSLAKVRAPSRVTPRWAARRCTASANGALSYQPVRSASMAARRHPGRRAWPGSARRWREGRAGRSAGNPASAHGSASRHSRPPGAGRGPAGTCPADAGRGSGLRPCQPGPGTGHGRLLPGRWGCGWPPVPRPGAGAPAAGSPAGRSWALSPGALGIGDGAITWQRTSMRCSSRARS